MWTDTGPQGLGKDLSKIEGHGACARALLAQDSHETCEAPSRTVERNRPAEVFFEMCYKVAL